MRGSGFRNKDHIAERDLSEDEVAGEAVRWKPRYHWLGGKLKPETVQHSTESYPAFLLTPQLVKQRQAWCQAHGLPFP